MIYVWRTKVPEWPETLELRTKSSVHWLENRANTWCFQLLYNPQLLPELIQCKLSSPQRVCTLWVSPSLLCRTYNCPAHLACSGTLSQKHSGSPCGVCVWIKSSSMVCEATTKPLKDNSSVCIYHYIYLYTHVGVCVCETSVGSGRTTFPVKC